jgi:hypothetical protein
LPDVCLQQGDGRVTGRVTGRAANCHCFEKNTISACYLLLFTLSRPRPGSRQRPGFRLQQFRNIRPLCLTPSDR